MLSAFYKNLQFSMNDTFDKISRRKGSLLKL